MDETKTIAPQTVYVDNGYIMGINPNGTEVTTDYNCSACWLDDAPAYYLDGDTVRETTAAEREAWVEAHTPTTEDSTEDIMLEMLADHEERICLMELGVEE